MCMCIYIFILILLYVVVQSFFFLCGFHRFFSVSYNYMLAFDRTATSTIVKLGKLTVFQFQ